MGWKRLSTDYKDISWSGLKKYTQIDNDDGTVSFRDDTRYTNKESSFFGAKDANQINEAVNYIMTKLENGTDLYSAFQEFFSTQRELFIREKDDKVGEINGYITNLKARGDTALTTVESNHRQRMSAFEDTQKNEFNSWFAQMRNHLSSDQAGKLQLQIEDLKVLLDGFASKETVFSDDGSITEKMGNKKLVTEFVSDNVITKKLYISDVLKLTKTTTFSEDGKSIKEVIA